MTTWRPLVLYAAAAGGFTLVIAAAVLSMAADHGEKK